MLSLLYAYFLFECVASILDKIDIKCFVNSNFCSHEVIVKVQERLFNDFKFISFTKSLNELSIENQLHLDRQKSTHSIAKYAFVIPLDNQGKVCSTTSANSFFFNLKCINFINTYREVINKIRIKVNNYI